MVALNNLRAENLVRAALEASQPLPEAAVVAAAGTAAEVAVQTTTPAALMAVAVVEERLLQIAIT